MGLASDVTAAVLRVMSYTPSAIEPPTTLAPLKVTTHCVLAPLSSGLTADQLSVGTVPVWPVVTAMLKAVLESSVTGSLKVYSMLSTIDRCGPYKDGMFPLTTTELTSAGVVPEMGEEGSSLLSSAAKESPNMPMGTAGPGAE